MSDDEDYEYKRGITISIEKSDMDKLVSNSNIIVVVHDFNCYCYKDDPHEIRYVVQGDKLTHRYVIDELFKQGMKGTCNHCFLEGFDHIGANMYSMFFGS